MKTINTLPQLINKIKRINALTMDKNKQLRVIILNKQTLEKLVNNIYLITGVYIIHRDLPDNLYSLETLKQPSVTLYRPTELIMCKKIKTFNQLENTVHKIEKQEKSFISIAGSLDTINLITPAKLRLLSFNIYLLNAVPKNILYALPTESAKQFININNTTDYAPVITPYTTTTSDSIYYWSRYNTNDTK